MRYEIYFMIEDETRHFVADVQSFHGGSIAPGGGILTVEGSGINAGDAIREAATAAICQVLNDCAPTLGARIEALARFLGMHLGESRVLWANRAEDLPTVGAWIGKQVVVTPMPPAHDPRTGRYYTFTFQVEDFANADFCPVLWAQIEEYIEAEPSAVGAVISA